MWGYHRQGSCQAGFSAAIAPKSNSLFIGAPGSWYWQGQMYSIDVRAKFSFTPGLFGGEFGSGQVIRQNLDNRPAAISTKEGPPEDDDTYLGYSLTVGDFTGAGTEGVAVGMPKAADLKGKIVLFTWNLTNHQNITGEQLGSYFGYALACADVDGDGLDDLIIGAPFFTEPNNEGKYEVGRVYVLYQGGSVEGRFHHLHILDGINSKSRFGLSLASLGDINLDEFGDFAVGAPYDGPHGRGAVYIYHGSEKGVRKEYSQVIYAEDVAKFSGLSAIETFGWSLAGGLDMDENDYPDMAIGAYLSDTAFFFRSRPVVNVDAQVTYLTPHKQIILDEKNCTLRNGQPVPCTSFNVCLKYTGVGVPNSQVFNIGYVLDSKKTKGQRMFFRDMENRYVFNETLTLRKDDTSVCRSKAVYLTNEIRDKLTPLEVEVHYSLAGYGYGEQSYRRDFRAQLIPILDLNTPPMRSDAISVHKFCGPDNVCIPNLRLLVTTNVQRYLLGSHEKLELYVIVQNDGEDSFESSFEIQLPAGVDYIKVVEYEKDKVRIFCSLAPNNTVKCDIGNPLPAHRNAKFRIILQPYHTEGMNATYDFYMSVNSTNPEESYTLEDNKHFLSIPIWVDSKLALDGTSKPADVHYNYSSYSLDRISLERDIGPQVVHIYSIRNNGPSSINEAEIFILWPLTTLAGDDLLYLLEQPQTLGNVKCEPASANYKHYGLEYRNRTIWKTYGIELGSESGETFSASTGKVTVEEGKTNFAQVSGEQKQVTKVGTDESKFDTGDASFVYSQRHKSTQDKSNTGEKVVHVLEDTGNGSKTIVTEHKWEASSIGSGPVINKTYTRQHTYYGRPEDRSRGWVDASQQSGTSSGSASYGGYSGSSSNSGTYGGTSQTSGTYGGRSGGQDSITYHETSRHESHGSRKRPTIVYTSSGSHYGQESVQQGQSATSNVEGGSQTTLSVSGSETKGHYVPPHRNEDGSVSGSVTYVESPYPGYRPPPPRPELLEGNNGYSYDYGRDHNKNFKSSVTSDEVYGQDENKLGFEQKHSLGRVHQENRYELGHGDVELQRRLQEEARRRQESRTGFSQEEGHVSTHQHSGGRVYDRYNHSRSEQDASSYGIGAAALNPRGFKTTTVELHPVQSVDQQIDGYARTNLEGHSGVSAYGSDSGMIVEEPFDSKETFTVAGRGGESKSFSSGSGSSYGGGYEKHYESRYSSSSRGLFHSATGREIPNESPPGDNVPTSKPDLSNPVHRGKRQAPGELGEIDLASILECKATKCIPIRCTTGRLLKDQEVFIALRSRVNVHTLRNISVTQSITFSSMMLARISKLPYIGKPVDRPVHTHEIFTTVSAPEPEIKPDMVPLWVVVLSAVAGTAILLLLAFLLYKCGFFKRNRPSSAPERQPLNRNGHFNHGDEAL
ncbi:integrin alpha-PS2 isoform X1 [Agrilus planipennis]|nr:integrin alpha-PS2 isoform X1 [Agrilus planipennis]XP_025836182.1 integrin alpha-PS2 isoform X1 [Agrilus planipennis]